MSYHIKIEKVEPQTPLTFGQLGLGETFQVGTEIFLWMKIVEPRNKEYNAVALNDGDYGLFDNNKEVIPRRCKLEILD